MPDETDPSACGRLLKSNQSIGQISIITELSLNQCSIKPHHTRITHPQCFFCIESATHTRYPVQFARCTQTRGCCDVKRTSSTVYSPRLHACARAGRKQSCISDDAMAHADQALQRLVHIMLWRGSCRSCAGEAGGLAN